jgi:hypothetical protein
MMCCVALRFFVDGARKKTSLKGHEHKALESRVMSQMIRVVSVAEKDVLSLFVGGRRDDDAS